MWQRNDLHQSSLTNGLRASFYRQASHSDSSWSLSDLVNCDDSTATREYYDSAPLILLEDVERYTGDLVDRAALSRRNASGRYKVYRENHLLYGRMRPALNKCMIVPVDVSPGHCSPEFLVLRVREPFDPFFVCSLILSEAVCQKLAAFVSGSSRPRVQWEHFANVQIDLPSSSRQRIIALEYRARLTQLRAAKELLSRSRAALMGRPVL